MIEFIQKNWIEILGVIASIFVLLAFICKNIKIIRIVDTIGAVIFIIYGFLINSISIIILNFILVGVQIFNIIKLINKEKGEDKNVSQD